VVLQVSEKTVQRRIAAGELSTVLIGRQVRIRPESVPGLISAGTAAIHKVDDLDAYIASKTAVAS
jgi:excisionase family DNA binding protein